MARIFKYEGKEYPDPDSSMSVDEVKQSMANFFPELYNANTRTEKKGDDQVIYFEKVVGKKG